MKQLSENKIQTDAPKSASKDKPETTLTNLLFVFLSVLLLATSSCKKDTDSPAPVEDFKIDHILTLQEDANTLFSSKLQTNDTLSALNSVYQMFMADTSVKQAYVGEQGIAVEYKSGIRGGLFIDGEDSPSGKSHNENLLFPEKLTQLKSTLPASKKIIFLNPHNYERTTYANHIKTHYDMYLPLIAFPGIINLYNEMSNIEAFTNLSEYGYVHIYSHGWAWPHNKAIAEVYLMMGGFVTEALTTKYLNEIKSGDIIISFVNEGVRRGNKYFISPKFFAAHNDFRQNNTLVYGGFCYSFLGSWPQVIINNSHAAVYTGFDWSVYTNKNSDWSVYMLYALTDTSKANPTEINKWFTDSTDISKKYWFARDKKYVNIHYTGASDFALWTRVKIDSLSPARGTIGTSFNIYGKGFGNTQSTNTVTFGTGTAGISAWSATRITTSVPAGAVTGKVFVTVDGKKSNSVLFTVNGPEISAIVPDSAMVGETVKINGKNFGTNLSVLKIFFGNTQATEITNLSNTSLDVKVPAGASNGNVVVQVGDGKSNVKYFKVIMLKPIKSFFISLSVRCNYKKIYTDNTTSIGSNNYSIYFGLLPCTQKADTIKASWNEMINSALHKGNAVFVIQQDKTLTFEITDEWTYGGVVNYSKAKGSGMPQVFASDRAIEYKGPESSVFLQSAWFKTIYSSMTEETTGIITDPKYPQSFQIFFYY